MSVFVWSLLCPTAAGQEAEASGHLSVLTVLRPDLLLLCMHGMMSLCYGNISRAGVCGISVTLCTGRVVEHASDWIAKPCSSVTHHRPEVIWTKIVLKEINSSNHNIHILL